VLAEDPIGLGVPVRLAETLERRHAKVVRHDAGNLAVPRSLGIGFPKLLIESSKEGNPDRGPREAIQILHLAAAGAGVVPGWFAGIPFAQSGHSAGA
jgi:hypothetical protein